MPTLARRTIALTALAVAIIAAAVALDLPSAAAQSEDEQAGRIVARRLDDGRTEFGWRPAGGARVLPRLRYFPADATVDRWLNSSPVEVDGAEIGQINARLRSDGRIEFAFTPTDGERIAPPARYFPVDATVGRWLRSTEIAIGPPRPTAGFIAVSAAGLHTCAIRTSGAIECWGANRSGKTDAPAGSDFTAVSAGGGHNCALRTSGEIECWGSNESSVVTVTEDGEKTYIPAGRTDAPAGSFTAVSAGAGHNCALRESGEIECWGGNTFWRFNEESQADQLVYGGQTDAPAGPFVAVSAGYAHTCALRESGEIECWGANDYGQTDATAGSFTAVSAGGFHTCALRESGAIECWGANDYGQTAAPAGPFTAVSTGTWHTCALRESGEIECWGANDYGQTGATAGSFTAVSAGFYHSCGLRESGAIECWGWNNFGQLDAPAP